MADDILINKAASIERCVARAREEYAAAGLHFTQDFTRQDAAILNIQRACEASLDMGLHLIRVHKLGAPQSARQVFDLLVQAGYITVTLAEQMKKMVGFRNIAVHDYQQLLLPITERIINQHLDEFMEFSRTLLRRKT